MEVNDGKYYVEQCRTLCQTIRNDSTDAAVKIAAGLVDACRQASTTKNLTLSDLWNELEDENKNLLTDFVGCFELCKNSSLVILLLRILDVFINRTTKGRNSRLGLVARVNGAQMVLKCLLPFLQSQNLNLDVVEPLIYLLLLIGGVDKKIYLKMRLTGLLKAATDAVCQQTTPSLSLLDLLTVAAQSPLNALTLCKQKELIPSLIRVLQNTYSSKQNLELTRKCLELAYYIGKTKKNRQKMVASGFIPVALDAFRFYFENRSDTQATKVCLVSLGLIRLLARTKTGREELVSANGLATFKNAAKLSLDGGETNSLAKELDSAVCSVCLRCLPPKKLPLEKIEHPLPFSLPDDETCRRPAEDNSDSDDDNAEPPAISENEDEECLGDDPNSKSSSSYVSSELAAYRKFCAEFGGITPDEKSSNNISKKVDTVGQTAPVRSTTQGHRRSSSAGLDGSNSALARIRSESENSKLAKRMSRRSADPHPESVSKKEKKLAADAEAAKKLSDAQEFPAPTSLQPPTSSTKNNYLMYEPKEYIEQTKSTKHVSPFFKVAYPDYVCGYPDLPLQPLREFPNALLQRILGEMENSENKIEFETRTVYNLDELIVSQPISDVILRNDDEERAGVDDPNCDHLKFESRFECGNLRKVEQVAPFEYELILSSDINQLLHHYQWFYFEVSNMKQDVPYVFKIVNLVKSQSLFATGMQPVIFSVTEAKCGRPGWARCGQAVVYYRNNFTRPTNNASVGVGGAGAKKQTESRCFYTASFTVSFRHAYDVCYIAYHYPYTYTMIKANLLKWQQLVSNRNSSNVEAAPIIFRKDILTNSLGGNNVYMLTITSAGTQEQISRREVIFLTSRVHPGEANASWMMHGTIRFILSDHPLAQQARDVFVFKIVPMLNPDGVVNGNHRCSLAGQDLNRQWLEPVPQLHPSIYHSKNVLLYLHSINKTPLVFCDYHGHSRKKNVFVYGNNPAQSWWPDDHAMKHNYEFYQLPELLDEFSPGFSLKYCSFQIQKGKESSARVNVWRQMGVRRSYTMEASYGGFDRGSYAGYQIGTRELIEMGEKFVECLVVLKEYIDVNRSPSKKFESSDDDSEDSPTTPAKEP